MTPLRGWVELTQEPDKFLSRENAEINILSQAGGQYPNIQNEINGKTPMSHNVLRIFELRQFEE
jgi:hypothetical protein